MNKGMATTGLFVVNLLIAVFFAFGYVAFTSNMVVKTGIGSHITRTYMAHGGLNGSLARYAYCAVAALFLQGVLAIFNLSVLQWIEPDRARANRICLALALSGFGTMLLISGVLIGLETF